MSLTYSTFYNTVFNTVAALSTGNGSSATDPQWAQEIPNIIDYAEQRIYRDLDLLATRIYDGTSVLTPGNRLFTLPTSIGTFVVLEHLNLIIPSTATVATGDRVPLVPVSRAYMDAAWPSGSQPGAPQVYSPRDNATVWIGPAPDASYVMEAIGTQRPTPLSSGNSVTYLTTVLPDLFFAASMVRASGFMRDFGSQTDNPSMAVAWESQYQILLKSADMEEARKMYRSAGWTAQAPRAASAPQRTQ